MTVVGKWRNDELIWIFSDGDKILHEVTDQSIKDWLFKQDIPNHSKPYDGLIRRNHTDLYAKCVLTAEEST